MPRRGFTLRRFFIVWTLLGVLAWAVVAPSLASCITTVTLWSLAGAIRWRRLYDNPVGGGAAGAAAAVVAFIISFWPLFLGRYFFHNSPDDYFEDGFFVEAFLYPVIYCGIYAPIAAVAGGALGFVVWVIGDHLGRPALAARPTLALDPFA